MQTETQNRPLAFYSPFFVLIICFILVVFSINQIIDMAKPELIDESNKLKNDQSYSSIVNSLMQSTSQIDYKEFESKLAASFQDHPTFQAKFNIDPQIEKQPIVEQNYIIRLKLIEWKLGQLEDKMSHMSSTPSESLIFKKWFWIYNLLIWAGSIIGGQILTFHTNRLINNCWIK